MGGSRREGGTETGVREKERISEKEREKRKTEKRKQIVFSPQTDSALPRGNCCIYLRGKCDL